MANRKKPKSLFRRLIYFIVMMMTGGAGVGGWALKDHPVIQAVLGHVLPQNEDGTIDRAQIKAQLTSVVKDAFKNNDPRKPGLYEVKVTEVRLDPKLFKDGQTVDIQARIRKRDQGGNETTVWESRPFGENLGRAGKDDLTATWSNRPFEIDWSPTDKVVVEIWNRRAGFFDKKELKMNPPDAEQFPLSAGPHPLSLSGANLDTARNRIVFETRRIGDAPVTARTESRNERNREVAERPIIIK